MYGLRLPPLAIVAGTRFDRYEIIAPLGRGGMGEVYTARDTQLGRQVALKFLPELFTADRGRLARFAQEARAASALNHPNIITIHEIGQADGTYYIATELVAGETLRQRLVRAPLAIEEALEIAAQTCAALAAAHEAGIVHRDIKPENIMLRRDGYVKVLDFGLAKLTDTDDAATTADAEAQTRQLIHTAPGTVVGTVDYMSPEQARALSVDERTDIWALGVVLYEMVAGRRPFTGETKPDVLAAILKTEPEPLASPHEPVPDELRRIVHKTLRVRREERYQTIRDLLVDLKSLKRELEFSAHSLRATAPATQPAQASQTAQIAPAASTSPSSILAAPRFSLRHALLLVPLAALVVGATWWFVARRNGQVGALALKTTEVVNWQSAPGEVYSIGTFSPDARLVAFASTKSGTKNIWIKQTTAGEPVQITNDEFKNDGPVWSPTGEEIAFFSQRGEQYGIWRTPALGGTPTLVKTFAVGEGDVRPKRWAKNGLLYYELRQNLFALDLNTGSATQLTDLGPNRADANSFSISPDGERIAYLSPGARGGNNVCYVSARGGQAVQLTNDAYEHRNTIWASDGQRVLYSAQVDGTFQIFAVALDGQPPLQLTTGERDSFVLDVSADGTRVLYGSTQEESDVWGVRAAGGEEFAVATDITAELWPAASPDGQTIVYQAIKNLSQGDKLFNGALLAKRAAADAPPRQLAAEGFLPQWSPDGKQVAFMRLTGESQSLWTVPATGGSEKQLVAGGLPTIENTLLPYNRSQVNAFSWSPDGSRIAYCSRASGARNVRVINADGAGDAQITDNSDANVFLSGPVWSPDGKRIAYFSKLNKPGADGKLTQAVWVNAPETKDDKAVFQTTSLLRLLGWSQTEKELFFAVFKSKGGISAPADVELMQVAVETGAARSIADLQATYFYNIHLSPDRKTVAFAAHRDGKDNVWLMPTAGGAARRLTANNDPRLYFSSLAWSPDGRTLYFGKQSRHSLLSMITNFR